MASGHLISLPSLRASDENGKRETASPRARRPAPGTRHGALPARLPFPGACVSPGHSSQHFPGGASPQHSARALPPPPRA